jgi:phosphoglycolate phosphatase
MNTIDSFACRCSSCAGATCTCGCQAAPASQSGCGCGCGTGQACRCGDTGACALDHRGGANLARRPDLPMRYDLIIFDLDGTLADSFTFFVSVHNQLADRHGFRRIAAAEIDALRGRSAREVIRHVRLPRWKLPWVARSFVRLMRAAEIPLFAGIGPMLQHLQWSGAALALVSSNAADNCRRILGDAHWQRLGHVECGASIFGKRRRIVRILRAAGVDPTRAIYIGDQSTDAEAARRAGVAFGAVAWGYATRLSLERLQPAHLFDAVEDLAELTA